MASESAVTVVHRVCAWCRREFVRERWLGQNEAEITTWGICSRCRRRLEDAAAKAAGVDANRGRSLRFVQEALAALRRRHVVPISASPRPI